MVNHKYKVMKAFKYMIMALAAVSLVACSDDDEYANPGRPTVAFSSLAQSAYYADSIPFTVTVGEESGIPLSVVDVELLFNDEVVASKQIRTRQPGNYSGKLYAPFLQNIPDGKATMHAVLTNTNLGKAEVHSEIALSRPQFPYITLVMEDGTEKRMARTGQNQYGVTDNFDKKVKGYFKAPAYGDNGNELVFGWNVDAVGLGTTELIPFSNAAAGNYEISFNTLTFAAAPFVSIKFADTEMTMVDENNYYVDMTINKGDVITTEGIDLDAFYVSPDFFTDNGDGTLTWNAMSGEYKVTADFGRSYFRVEAMENGEPMKLKSDGSGALWIIGDNVGLPSLDNTVGWNTDNAICMAQVADKVYQITLVAGQQVGTSSINFKFFDTKGWDSSISGGLTTTSDIVFVGDGSNGRDAGNLGIVDGKSLEEGATYVFTVDVTGGIENAVLTVTKK